MTHGWMGEAHVTLSVQSDKRAVSCRGHEPSCSVILRPLCYVGLLWHRLQACWQYDHWEHLCDVTQTRTRTPVCTAYMDWPTGSCQWHFFEVSIPGFSIQRHTMSSPWYSSPFFSQGSVWYKNSWNRFFFVMTTYPVLILTSYSVL